MAKANSTIIKRASIHSFALRSAGAINRLDGFIGAADSVSLCWRRIAALP
jgi:hypothetical protein